MSLPFNEIEKVDLADFKLYLRLKGGMECMFCGTSEQVTLFLDTGSYTLRARCLQHQDQVTTCWIPLDEKDIFTLKCLL